MLLHDVPLRTTAFVRISYRHEKPYGAKIVHLDPAIRFESSDPAMRRTARASGPIISFPNLCLRD